jgi:uroporphyrinogen decarboxylase
MTPKQRLITALDKGLPDRLPATTHHVFDPWLKQYMGGITRDAFFEALGLDAIRWVIPVLPDTSRGEFFADNEGQTDFLEIKRIVSDSWRIFEHRTPNENGEIVNISIETPKGSLHAVLQKTPLTTWVIEPLLKEKTDIELFQAYQSWPICDVEEVDHQYEEFGQKGIIRGFIIPSELYGQPGCWQDFCCLRGTVKAILDTFDDPQWVHQCLSVLLERKLHYVQSLAGAKYDLIELGGGDASTTVISPDIFRQFVAPYDSQLIEACHAQNQRVVYHTCGGMMPILEDIAAMNPDAMETFTPPDIGGDVDLASAKKRIGDKVCMIGGFDQVHYLSGVEDSVTRKEVQRCFNEAGEGGGYILCPSDHFFDAEPELLAAFADEASKCTYS